MNAHPVLDSITKIDSPPAALKPPTVFVEVNENGPVNHYARTHRGVELDVYRILKLYGITDPAIAHAVKKLLRFGAGQHKKPRHRHRRGHPEPATLAGDGSRRSPRIGVLMLLIIPSFPHSLIPSFSPTHAPRSPHLR